MERKAKIIRTSDDKKRCIAIDVDNATELLNFFQQDDRYQKKFFFITDLILGNHPNKELYGKEEPNEKCKGVTAMKFFKGQENSRVYCKEVLLEDDTLIVVAAEVLIRKKQQKLTHKEINVIEKVGSYEYTEIE